MIKKVPNILSSIRIVLAPTLILLRARGGIFIAIYLVCGLTDWLDGLIARKYDAQSPIGSTLDTLGDSLLLISAFISFLLIVEIDFPLYAKVCMIYFGAMKVVGMIISRVKFKHWNWIHTYLSKTGGVMLYLSLPIFVQQQKLPDWLLITLAVPMVIQPLEEIIMMLRQKEYNPDAKGILGVFSKKKESVEEIAS